MRLSQQVRNIEWIITAGELGALLKEAKLIKQHKPIFNQQLRGHKKLFCIKLITEPNSYHRLQIITLNEVCVKNLKNTYGLFRQKVLAETKLRELVKERYLCPKLCGLEKSNNACFYYQIQRCRGACVEKESVDEYNLRLESVLSTMQYRAWPYSGRIAIKETYPKTDNTEYHIVDEWCHLGTVNKLTDISIIEHERNKLDFDLDVY